MTPHQAFADGRLAEAVEMQEAAVAAAPADPAARLFLVELLAFAGRLADARAHLDAVASDDPGWPRSRRRFRRLFRADRRRARGRCVVASPDPPAEHVTYRMLAGKAVRAGKPERAVKLVDRADAVTPEVRGFLDGQEFTGLRDADDRFASVLEGLRGGEAVWFPWEVVRRVRLTPAKHPLDQLYRPADVMLRDGTEYAVHLPLVYPGSAEAGDEFALGLETDHVCPDGGPVRCVGGKLLLVEDAEVMLRECRMIEIR